VCAVVQYRSKITCAISCGIGAGGLLRLTHRSPRGVLGRFVRGRSWRGRSVSQPEAAGTRGRRGGGVREREKIPREKSPGPGLAVGRWPLAEGVRGLHAVAFR
jgi:hypothetical protein